MRDHLHPTMHDLTVTCASCGSAHDVRSTVASLSVEVCSACHPAMTGRERAVSTGGRVARFQRRRDLAA